MKCRSDTKTIPVWQRILTVIALLFMLPAGASLYYVDRLPDEYRIRHRKHSPHYRRFR